MGDDNALLGAGEGYIKFASIFTYKTFVGLIVVVGIASVSNIGDDDVLQRSASFSVLIFCAQNESCILSDGCTCASANSAKK